VAIDSQDRLVPRLTIEDDEVDGHQTQGERAGLAEGLLTFKRVDPFYGGEETHTTMQLLDGPQAECSGEMGLPRTGTADQHDIVCGVDEGAAVQLAYPCFIDGALAKVEAGQIAVDGEAGSLLLLIDRADFAFCDFRLDERVKDGLSVL